MGNIILIGMPGSGKSTLGVLLAKKLTMRFIDLDEEIVRASGKTIPEIFEESGEPGFRKIEKETLRSLSEEKGIVLATGGGTVIDPENVRLLREMGTVIFLDRPLKALTTRVRTDTRPLLAGGSDKMTALYHERRPLYLRACHHRMVNEGFPKRGLAALVKIVEKEEINH